MTARVVSVLLTTVLAASGAVAAELPEGGIAAAADHKALGPAREAIDWALHWISTGIEVSGVAIIVVGAAVATLLFLYGGAVTVGWPASFRRYRANLGRAILLGLELLVAADIIGTIAVAATFESLAVLALIVVIRTFLSFSLEVEIEGYWPWRRAEFERDRGAAPAGDDSGRRL
jgi:uncharacterized membrane protein